ncbi:NAD-dependent epimerase/dehydratase family protein [Rhodanobacter soli]|uniref:NAD-dependent epimerase/dehydratase family protein n=1 Tax=Rhodanobacter soli TaxID=590609 RepID=UPI0031DAD26E
MSDRILVIGAGGFIGQHLVRALARQGELVIAASRSEIDFGLPNVETVIAELREPKDFAPLIARSRAAVYLASTSTPGISAARPLHELVDNLQPMAGLLQVLQDHSGVDLLYLSSGGSLYASTGDIAADEATRAQPRSYHGAGKIAAEYFISAWCNQYSGRATILRPSNVYGPGQLERAGFGIVPTALGKIKRDEVLHIWGDGSAVRDYLYIDDLVELITTILARQMSVGARIVNACSGTGVSLNELFAAMEAVTGRPLRRSYEMGRAVDATRVVMDPTLANREYGCSPATPLHEGLERTWAWLNSTAH